MGVRARALAEEGLVKTIKELRAESGWTQLEMAVKLGVTPVTVYNWERGKYEPTASMFRKIARLFGVAMDDIALSSEDRAPGQQEAA